jgi:phosphate transport system protein
MRARANFDHELELLNNDIKEMGRMVESSIKQCFIAFEHQDYDMAKDIIKGDRTINDMERSIEAQCLSLILRQQPVASDLRVVSSALKVVTDLERIGDHASDIAELVLRIKGEQVYHVVRHIPAMAAAAGQMVLESIDAFVTQDSEKANEIVKQDDVVDNLFEKVKNDVILLLQQSSEHADQCIDLLMIAKYLERIGDHAVNVCEWAEFAKTGTVKNVRIL